jgi:predicted aminopeptidase
MSLVTRLVAACVVVLAGGCTSIDYYLQAVSGQLDVWQRARAIDDVMADAGTDAALKDKLNRVRVIREFASRELSLPENASYRRYADVERRYVVWNVFAAPEFSLAPVQWCFPFAGCVGYRDISRRPKPSGRGAICRRGPRRVCERCWLFTPGWFADLCSTPSSTIPIC